MPVETTPVVPVVEGKNEEVKLRIIRNNTENNKERGLLISCPGCRAIRDNKPSEAHSA